MLRAMAELAKSLPENAAGDFFVDASCIDCDLCRQIAPESFARSDRRAQSYVERQPSDAISRHRALMALVTCPTASIGTRAKTAAVEARAAAHAFPEPVTADVYFCGFASADSYGAASFLLRRPDGNVLVDSPRAAAGLMNRVAELGGVRWLFLTHRDDVAAHRAWRARFGCERVLHRADLSADTRGVERVIDGRDPVPLAADLLVIPVPGHTRGSQALLAGETYLFTGDHLWANDEGTGLEAGREVCWYSWSEQRTSVGRLAEHRFRWVLPGHGRRFRAPSAGAMRDEVLRVAASM
jgi:glyoxylase-like metal-dependent hydrolase (beta-lactamase superfamily II)/ferredoxin